jgi:hypothetical protein
MVNLNDTILKLIKISSHENILLKSIEHFYQNLNSLNDFLDIINSESKISIRLIDYFVTKYSKKNKICIKSNNEGVADDNNKNMFNIYQSYKQQLKIYQKRCFDPFARGIRIPYFIKEYCLITTIGQLNFFKWFISKNIINYVMENRNNIEFDMNKNKKIKPDCKVKKINKLYKKKDIKINNYVNNINIVKNTSNILVTF